MRSWWENSSWWIMTALGACQLNTPISDIPPAAAFSCGVLYATVLQAKRQGLDTSGFFEDKLCRAVRLDAVKRGLHSAAIDL